MRGWKRGEKMGFEGYEHENGHGQKKKSSNFKDCEPSLHGGGNRGKQRPGIGAVGEGHGVEYRECNERVKDGNRGGETTGFENQSRNEYGSNMEKGNQGASPGFRGVAFPQKGKCNRQHGHAEQKGHDIQGVRGKVAEVEAPVEIKNGIRGNNMKAGCNFGMPQDHSPKNVFGQIERVNGPWGSPCPRQPED